MQSFTTEFQSEQVQTHPQKFAPTLALKLRISLAEQSCLTSLQAIKISAANAFQPVRLPFGPQKSAFYRGQFVIWPRVLIIMIIICF